MAGIFLAGIGSLIVFAIINTKHMKSDKPNTTTEIKIISTDSTKAIPSGIGIEKLGVPVQLQTAVV